MGTTISRGTSDPGIDLPDDFARLVLATHLQAFSDLAAVLESDGAVYADVLKSVEQLEKTTESRFNMRIAKGKVLTRVLAVEWHRMLSEIAESRRLKNEPDSDDPDTGSLPVRYTQYVINKSNNRPFWAPLPPFYQSTPTVRKAAPLPFTFELDYIRFDPTVRNTGLGRLFCNALQQGLTRHTAGDLQYIHITICHFPIFFTIDSHYGWFRTKLVPSETPAGEIFPKHLSAPELEQIEENEKAIYRYTDLGWSTPLSWADARAFYYLHEEPAQLQETRALFSAINKALARPGLKRQVHEYAVSSKELQVALGTKQVSFATTSLKEALYGPSFAALVQSIDLHCKALGHSDDGMTRAVHLYPKSFAFLQQQQGGPLYVNIAELLLAFLIDHGRVMYRPVIIEKELAETLCGMYFCDKLPEIFERMATVCDPKPHFTQLGNGHWIWVPVKKPHSCTPDGFTYIPLPHQETQPLFMEDEMALPAAERPTKRHRPNTTLQCLHCAKLHAGVKAYSLAFCTPACSSAYYA